MLELPGSFETTSRLLDGVAEITQFGLPDDHYTTLPKKIEATTLADANRSAVTALGAGEMVWLVVGDRKKIDPGLKTLGFSQIRYLDADGNLVP